MLGNDAGANSCYRAMYPARALSARGHAVRYDGAAQPDLDPRSFNALDAVLVYRHNSKPVQRLLAHLREAGVGVVWDNDDLAGSVTADHPGKRQYGGLRGASLFQEIVRTVRIAHVVTTPSEVLAEQYQGNGATVRVIQNYVPDEFAAVARPPHDGVVVGWTAGWEHQIDRDRLGLPAVFEALLQEHRDLSVVTIGISLGLAHERCLNVRKVDFPQLAQALVGFDIGIAPLADVTINRARSTSKLKEYAVVGTPWLASPIGPYASLGTSEGGMLVEDSDWYDGIERLLVDRRRRRKLAKKASRWGGANLIGDHVLAWERAIEEAVAHANK